LIALAAAAPGWAVGFESEVWWSRLAQPRLRAWTAVGPARLVGQTRPAGDPDLAALAWFGLLLRGADAAGDPTEALWLCFLDGRPVGTITVQFLAWCADASSNRTDS